ncbi:MAG: DUF4397 domain-containing protein, partial [Rhodothermales bacterium]|nr:DUF4397 domain-containing protein [Rhodothermales bacterium]
FYVVHGATDAPAVDVVARDVGKLVPNAAYGDITDYLSVGPASYTLDVNVAGTETTAATFVADLSGAADAAIGVIASGFLDPTANQGGEGFGLLAVFADGATALLPAPEEDPTARVQIVHNAADPGAATVDIYLDGVLTLDDFAFRNATPFLDLPAESEIAIAVAPGTSTSVSDALATFPVTLEKDGTYTVVANGVLDPSSFAANPDGRSTGFNLWFVNSKESVADTSSTEFYIIHGASDAPGVDVIARDVAPLAEGAKYSDITGFIPVPVGEYTLDVNAAGTETTVASFVANLNGAGGLAFGVLASGFLDPTANQNGEGFGLLAVFPNGDTALLPTEEDMASARVQIIHNAADPGASMVDIYLGDELAVDDFMFQSATPFLDLPAGEEIRIGVAPGNSTSASEALATFPVTLDGMKTYTVVASGVLDPTAFAVNPDGIETGFTLLLDDSAVEAVEDDEAVNLVIVHGVTDAPAVDISARGVGLLASGVQYADISTNLSVPADDYTIDVLVAGTQDVVASFSIDLSTMGGGSSIVYASGFLDPSANNGGTGFALGTAMADGSSATAAVVTSVEGEGDDFSALRVSGNYPNPFSSATTVSFDLPSSAVIDLTVFDLSGREVARVGNKNFAAGQDQRIEVNMADLPSGVYMYRVKASTPSGVQLDRGRMILTR